MYQRCINEKTYRITDFKIFSTNAIVTLDIGFHFANDFLVTFKSRIRSRAPDDPLDVRLSLVAICLGKDNRPFV